MQPTKRNTSVRVWASSYKALDKWMRGSSIKRDSFLEGLLTTEIERLVAEVKEPNPPGVAKYIRRLLRALPKTDKCSLSLDRDLMNRIDSVLRQLDIPRNAFFNRVFFLLVAKPKHLKQLDVFYGRNESIEGSPMLDALGFLNDPFFTLRRANDDLLYRLVFPDGPSNIEGVNFFSMNCHVPATEWAAVQDGWHRHSVSMDDV